MANNVNIIHDHICSFVCCNGFSMKKKSRISTSQIIPISRSNEFISTSNVLINVDFWDFFLLINFKKFSIDGKITFFINFNEVLSLVKSERNDKRFYLYWTIPSFHILCITIAKSNKSCDFSTLLSFVPLSDGEESADNIPENKN